ncbi:Riboflavin biosynthesis intermediates N-glycosidase [Hyphodiscus hymeniophilus]|uniref:Riboflavin biosynthesis intermediates N-glycosidase n=1 Tax=Hyphodiscus hymeniophilus TaxID=353542 RepID=A0A9P7AY53_9HELO|nr:Riboflavin biosynthesis intermediates N-glycosidase [Hyphodiscus hymeniophilus]
MGSEPSSTSTDPKNGPIFFWREHGHEYGFLSQWYLSPFHAEDKSIVFQTAEQYMMYQKAVLFSDPETGAEILNTESPREQKALGRQVQNFDNEVWLENRERIVEDGSFYKFVNAVMEGEDLKQILLGTGDRELVEASPMDKIWGIGFEEKNAERQRARWGLNLLGKALMRARERIREEETK